MLLVVGLVALTVAVVPSARALGVDIRSLAWWPVAVALLVVSPATIVLNATELRLSAALVHPLDRRMPWPLALRTVIAATGANLLPLPAGALLRIGAIRRMGVSVTAATGVSLVAGAAWIAAGIGVAAVAVAGQRPGAAAIGLCTALAGLLAAGLLARRVRAGHWSRTFVLLGGVELLTALLHGARLWLAMLALGIESTVRQALVLGASAPLSAAAGVFPSGIGLAEGLTALLAPLAALPAAAGVLATALSRVVGLTATVLVAVPLGVRSVADNIAAARRRAAALEDADAAAAPPHAPHPEVG